MKKVLAVLLTLVLVFGLCACGGGEKSPAQESTSSTNQETMEASGESTESVEGTEEVDDGGIEVDEGLLSVEVTLPASFFEEETPEERVPQKKGKKTYRNEEELFMSLM